MKRNFCKNILTAKPIILLVLFLIYSKAAASQEYSSTRLSFDKGWRFHRWDVPFPVIKGHEFSNIRSNPLEQTVQLPHPVSARYFKFAALHTVEGNGVAVAELSVLVK